MRKKMNREKMKQWENGGMEKRGEKQRQELGEDRN